MRKSMKARMIVIFSSLILLSGLLTSFISMNTSVKIVTESLGNQALSISQQALKVIDTDQFVGITPGTGETDYYYELREKLNEIRETNGLVYLYTMRRQENSNGFQYMYVVDGMPRGSEEVSALGEVEDEINEYPHIEKAFETGEQQVGEMSHTEEYGALISSYVPIKSKSGEVIGIIGADFDATTIYSSMEASKQKIMFLTLFILIISIILIYITTLSIINPLQKLSRSVELIGKGDLTVSIESKRQDEIGILTHAFNQMLQDLKAIISVINHNSSELNETTSHLLTSASETKAACGEVAITMEQIAENVGIQQKSLGESAQVLQEMSMSINHVAGNSSIVSQLSSHTHGEVQSGNQKINKLIQQMNTISNSVDESSSSIMTLKGHSQEIESIVNIIQEISSQTNLLALNAAIEAARAGEAGKGFAVVADEVRKLAEQSEKSTVRIRNIIDRINKDTSQTVDVMDIVLTNVKEGMNAVGETGNVFRNISVAIEEVNEKIQEVTATSEELSAATEEIATSANETARIAEQASADTRDTVKVTSSQEMLMTDMSKSIEKLAVMASTMKELTDRFKL